MAGPAQESDAAEDDQDDEDGYLTNLQPPLGLNQLSADGWNLLNAAIRAPDFDKYLYDYLLFKRLQVEGLSWRQAAAKTGLSAALGWKWAGYDFVDVINASVKARRAKQRQGEVSREMPGPRPPQGSMRPGPKALPRPVLTEEDDLRSWQLLAQVVEDEEATKAIHLAAEGTLMGEDVPLVADVHRYALLGFCTAEISLLVARTRRRVQQLRKEDPSGALSRAFRWQEGALEREAKRERQRQTEASIRSFRGFETYDDLTPEQFRNLPDYSKRYRLPVHRPEPDTVTVPDNF